MPKGGYKLVSFNNENLTKDSNKVTIPGIYERLEANYGKPVMIIDLVVNGKQSAPFYGTVLTGDSLFVINYYTDFTSWYRFVVESDDSVRLSISTFSSAGDPPVSGEDGPSASM